MEVFPARDLPINRTFFRAILLHWFFESRARSRYQQQQDRILFCFIVFGEYDRFCFQLILVLVGD